MVVSGCSADAAEAIAAEIEGTGGATIHRTDIREPDDVRILVDRTIEAYGPSYVLVNHAAVQA